MKLNNLEFDIPTIDRVHSTPESQFLPLLKQTYPHADFAQTLDGRQLLYVDNGKSVLGVAHLDGTMPASHFFCGRRRSRPGDIVILSPFVDDRLGAFTLIHLLPQVNIECDLLFSVGEEIGQSTAADFDPPKQYNWMFQFDRKGTDVVHYQYTNEDWLTAIEKHFPDLEHGMFSDISTMDHVGCQGMNIGTAYYDYTTPSAWASLLELSEQVYKFKKFYDEFKDVPFITSEGKPRLKPRRGLFDYEGRSSLFDSYRNVRRSKHAKKIQINLKED